MKTLKVIIVLFFALTLFCSQLDINFVDIKSDNFKIIDNPVRGLYQKSLPLDYNFADYDKVITDKGFAVEFSFRIGADRYDKNKVFRTPRNFGIDSKGNIYIVDTGNNRVQKLSGGGKYLLTIGNEKGTDPGQFDFPSDVVFDKNDNVYVTDHNNKRVQVFSENGEFIKILDFGDSKPAFIAIDSEDNLYTYNMGEMDAVIKKYDNNGNLILSFGKPLDSEKYIAAKINYFSQAQVTVDKEDNVYVCYRTLFIIDKYDKNGVHLMRIKKEPRKWIKERLEETKNYNIDTGEERWGPFINDISISPEGYLWIAHTEGMDIYSPEGEYLYFLRMEGKGGTEFVPSTLHVKTEKQVYFLNETTGTMTIFYIIRKNI